MRPIPPRPAPGIHEPLHSKETLVPTTHPAASPTRIVRQQRPLGRTRDYDAWVSAEGLWPPEFISRHEARTGSYQLGCGDEHEPAAACGTPGCHGRPGDDNDPKILRLQCALLTRGERFGELAGEIALLDVHLIACTVRKADPGIA
jgi:hypothetical protein